jgi:hypothetical protein
MIKPYSELRCKPDTFNPLTVSKNMVNGLNFGVASGAYRNTIDSSFVEVATDRKSIVEDTPHEMVEFVGDFLLPNSIPDRVIIRGVTRCGVRFTMLPILDRLVP